MSNKLSLSASDRINALLDDSSFVEVGAYVTARSTDFNMQENDTPKDGVITGYGVVNGKLVYVQPGCQRNGWSNRRDAC